MHGDELRLRPNHDINAFLSLIKLDGMLSLVGDPEHPVPVVAFTDAGPTFQRLAEDARRELASHYLGCSQAEYHEIAFLFGDEDSYSFFRAFDQRDGATPGVWRERQAEPVAVGV